MCTALEELKKEGIQQGMQQGMQQGILEGKIEGIVKTYKDFGASKEAAAAKIRQECELSAEDAERYVKKYW